MLRPLARGKGRACGKGLRDFPVCFEVAGALYQRSQALASAFDIKHGESSRFQSAALSVFDHASRSNEPLPRMTGLPPSVPCSV